MQRHPLVRPLTLRQQTAHQPVSKLVAVAADFVSAIVINYVEFGDFRKLYRSITNLKFASVILSGNHDRRGQPLRRTLKRLLNLRLDRIVLINHSLCFAVTKKVMPIGEQQGLKLVPLHFAQIAQ
jgi:DUF1009 family protein